MIRIPTDETPNTRSEGEGELTGDDSRSARHAVVRNEEGTLAERRRVLRGGHFRDDPNREFDDWES